MYDVLIVGAGPVGSYIAGELAAQRHTVLVFEQHRKVGKANCCTGIVGKECVDAFPISREAIVREAKSATFFTPFGKSLRLEKETPQAFVMDRNALDYAMAKDARERGVQYLLDTRVKDIAIEKDFARLEVEIKGAKQVFEGKMVVIASGFGSKLTQSLGLGKCSDFVMGAQAEVEISNLNEVEIYFGHHIAPGFFAWIVPTFPGKALVGLLCRQNTGSHLRKFLKILYEKGKIITPEVNIKYGGIPLKPLQKTYMDRVIVAGDAAGLVKPTTGGGIYYGLISAQIAANTLHETLIKGNFNSETLRGYEQEWKRMLSRELKVDYYARWSFERLDDKKLEQLLGKIWSSGIHERLLKSTEFSFDWHNRLIIKGIKYLGLREAMSILWYLIYAKLFGSTFRKVS